MEHLDIYHTVRNTLQIVYTVYSSLDINSLIVLFENISKNSENNKYGGQLSMIENKIFHTYCAVTGFYITCHASSV